MCVCVYICISREGVAPSPTLWCSSYRKGSLRVTLDYGRQLYLLIYVYGFDLRTGQWIWIAKNKWESIFFVRHGGGYDQ